MIEEVRENAPVLEDEVDSEVAGEKKPSKRGRPKKEDAAAIVDGEEESREAQ